MAPTLVAMGVGAVRRLRSGWPLAGVFLSFAVGLAIAGLGGGALGGMLSVLVFGPAYLIQNSVRRRKGTLPAPPSKSAAEQAQSDARFLRVSAVAQLAVAIAIVVVVVIGPQWLPGRNWTALLLLGAAFDVSSAPYLWAIAEQRATQRTLRWAWGLSGALDVVLGAAAAAIAITNQRTHWIGGVTWSIAFAALTLLWLLGSVSHLARARSGVGRE